MSGVFSENVDGVGKNPNCPIVDNIEIRVDAGTSDGPTK